MAFASKTCNAHEARYGSTDGELLALVYGVTKFHHYIAGSSFTVVTDHQALLHLESAKSSSSRLARWALKLADYDFKVVYRAGGAHCNADGLTRAAAAPHMAKDISIEVASLQLPPASLPLPGDPLLPYHRSLTTTTSEEATWLLPVHFPQLPSPSAVFSLATAAAEPINTKLGPR